MTLSILGDFVFPVLMVLEELGGAAMLSDVETRFYEKFGRDLDPAINWQAITRNHGKELWRDYCGSRLNWRYLKPNNYIKVERRGSSGSLWTLTPEGRALTKSFH